jgi:histidine triad (HIT) family protein
MHVNSIKIKEHPMDCLFCKIIAGEIPANCIYKDQTIIAIDDIYPKAPHHKLIIPKKHIATLNDLQSADLPLVGQMMQVAVQLAQQLKINEDGYRVVINCNEGAGQSIFHIHMHLLGGREMLWPPG